MISEKDRSAIVELAGRYRAHRVLAFGSSADSSTEGRDTIVVALVVALATHVIIAYFKGADGMRWWNYGAYGRWLVPLLEATRPDGIIPPLAA